MSIIRSVWHRPGLGFYAAAARVRRRHLLVPVILLVHLLLIALLLLSPTAVSVEPASASPLAVFDVQSPKQEPAAAEPVPEPQPQELVMPQPRIEIEVEIAAAPPQPVFDLAAAERAGFGTTCDVADTLARAFTENPLLKSQLQRVGPRSRSVANAIMFWDGNWVKVPGGPPEDAVETLRRGILEGVRAAPPECLAQDVAGPRFIPVASSAGTIVLVVGSGNWRWGQLLATEQDMSGTTMPAPADAGPRRMM